MSRVKVLLYPFCVDRPYFEGYAWALQLCARMKASLQLFTIIPPTHDPQSSTDVIYHSLLEANGYFLQHYRGQAISLHAIPKETCIVQGDQFDKQLLLHLESNPVDIVILDPVTTPSGAQEIANGSRGVILLPKEKPGTIIDHGDRFLDRLRRAKLYRLPENFFDTLGRDNSLFNHIRQFFSKRSNQ
jgi:hypothetical protein